MILLLICILFIFLIIGHIVGKNYSIIVFGTLSRLLQYKPPLFLISPDQEDDIAFRLFSTFQLFNPSLIRKEDPNHNQYIL